MPDNDLVGIFLSPKAVEANEGRFSSSEFFFVFCKLLKQFEKKKLNQNISIKFYTPSINTVAQKISITEAIP